MPIWILIGIGLSAAASIAAAAVAIRRWVKVNGSVAFIGRSRSGKSTMIYFLLNGKVPKSGLSPTTMQTSEEGIKIGEKSFTIIDSAGDHLEHWRKAFEQCRTIVYFFDANRIAQDNPNALSQLRADAEHIEVLLEELKFLERRRFTILGTHSDQFEHPSDEARVRTNKELARLRYACGLADNGVIIGSLAKTSSARTLAKALANRNSEQD